MNIYFQLEYRERLDVLTISYADFDDFTLLAATLSKPRRRKQRGRGKTKDLIGRTIAQLVRFKALYIS